MQLAYVYVRAEFTRASDTDFDLLAEALEAAALRVAKELFHEGIDVDYLLEEGSLLAGC
jgi:hypothetical protein